MNTALPLTGRDLSPSLLHAIDSAVRRAIDEDIGQGDLTAKLVPAAQLARATIVCREQAVICGQPWVERCFQQLALQHRPLHAHQRLIRKDNRAFGDCINIAGKL